MCVSVRQHPTTFRHVSRGFGCPLSPRWLCHSKPSLILLSLVSPKRLLRRLAQFSTAAALVDTAVYGGRNDDRIYPLARTAPSLDACPRKHYISICSLLFPCFFHCCDKTASGMKTENSKGNTRSGSSDELIMYRSSLYDPWWSHLLHRPISSRWPTSSFNEWMKVQWFKVRSKTV